MQVEQLGWCVGSEQHQGLSCPRVSLEKSSRLRSQGHSWVSCTLVDVAWGHLGAFVGCHVRTGYPPHFHPGIRFIPHCCQKGQFFSGTNVSLPFTASIPRGHFKILFILSAFFFFWYLGSVTELVRLSYLQKPLPFLHPTLLFCVMLGPQYFLHFVQ